MNIPFMDLNNQISEIRDEIDQVINNVISKAEFINGEYNTLFCEAFAKYLNVKHCIGVGNGTDALEIALKALGINSDDEVIVPANSFVATAEAVTNVGAKVVFADCKEDDFTINTDDIIKKITKKTKVIIPVHLYGYPADMDEIMQIAKDNNLFVLEDAAQAHGAKYRDIKVGTIGHIGAFSFYPGKNLGAFGDAGAVVTNNPDLAHKIKLISNHGRIDKYNHLIEGRNSRMDNLQAAVLCIKLKYLSDWNVKRRMNAIAYDQFFDNLFKTPKKEPEYKDKIKLSSCHLYVIKTNQRRALMHFLSQNGIATMIHYPTALPYLKAYDYLNHKPEDFPVAYENQSQILSLPMYPELTKDQIIYICDKIEKFFAKK